MVNRLQQFFLKTKVQPYYPYKASVDAGKAMDTSYRKLAEAINASPDELQLGPSTTMNIYVLAQALSEDWEAGDQVVVTSQDHEANIGAWVRLARQGIEVLVWEANPETGLLDTDDLKPLLSNRTRLVCVTHCSNVVAQINPVEKICEMAHAAGAMVVLDGVSYAPHGPVDVQKFGADVYLFSLYKTFGPHLGLMFVRDQLLRQIANQGHFFNASDVKKRLTPAGPDHGEIACAGGIADYYDAVFSHHFGPPGDLSVHTRVRRTFQLFQRHEETLIEPLLDFLRTKRGIRLIGDGSVPIQQRAPTAAFTCADMGSRRVVEGLAQADIAAGYGHFYAYRLMERLGIDPNEGVVRLSMAHYNTMNEVNRAIAALDRLLP